MARPPDPRPESIPKPRPMSPFWRIKKSPQPPENEASQATPEPYGWLDLTGCILMLGVLYYFVFFVKL